MAEVRLTEVREKNYARIMFRFYFGMVLVPVVGIRTWWGGGIVERVEEDQFVF